MRIFAHFAKSGSRTGTPRRSPAAGDSFRVSDMPDSGQQVFCVTLPDNRIAPGPIIPTCVHAPAGPVAGDLAYTPAANLPPWK